MQGGWGWFESVAGSGSGGPDRGEIDGGGGARVWAAGGNAGFARGYGWQRGDVVDRGAGRAVAERGGVDGCAGVMHGSTPSAREVAEAGAGGWTKMGFRRDAGGGGVVVGVGA